MLNDKESLAALGKQIGDKLSELTRGVRMGFGTFVDKPVMPYVSIAGKIRLEKEMTLTYLWSPSPVRHDLGCL